MNWKFWQRKSRRELEAQISMQEANLKVLMSDCARQARRADELEADLEEALKRAGELFATKASELEATPKPPIQPQIRPALELSLAEWRKEENLVASAANVLKHPDLRAMLDVLENEHPAKKGVVMGANLDQRAIWQAVGQGYQRFFDNLYALGQKPMAKKEVPETWADTNLTGGK